MVKGSQVVGNVVKKPWAWFGYREITYFFKSQSKKHELNVKTKSLSSVIFYVVHSMSIFNSAGRDKLAGWIFRSLHIDLIICGLYLILNINATYYFIIGNSVGIGLGILVFCFYVAILDTIRQKIQEYRDSSWKIIAEVIATVYCYFHCILYILIIGSVISVMYHASTGVALSSDFLMSWAIILATVVLGIFYLGNRELARSYKPEPREVYTESPREFSDTWSPKKEENRYDDSETKTTWEKTESQKGTPSQSSESACFICGKVDPMPVKGMDGRFYCRDHVLLANQIFSAGFEQSVQKSGYKTDTQCSGCGSFISRKDAIKCGPCGNIFCARCWESHRWIHGTAPAMGISYRADGTYIGYDGTENYKRY